MSELRDAMIKRIERGGIVVQVARVIDPAAFAEWFDGTGAAAKKHEPSTSQRYAQSVALNKAEQIVKLLARVPALAVVAADDEAQSWSDMGIPMDDSTIREIVDQKYT